MPEGAPTPPEKLQIDFTKNPERLDEYNIGDPITRENFTSFLIFTFSVSRGSVHSQQIFLKWLKFKYGFDYEGALVNFTQTNHPQKTRWDVLTAEEKQKVTDAFNRVKGHWKRDLDEFDKNIHDIVKPALDRDLDFFDFENIPTLSEFRKKVEEYREFRRKLREALY